MASLRIAVSFSLEALNQSCNLIGVLFAVAISNCKVILLAGTSYRRLF